MLRIVVFDEATSVKLRLEGKLTKETTPSLIERWADVRNRLNARKPILDLGDVVEIDDAGRRTLAWLARSGVQLGCAHPKVRSIVEDLACEVPGVPHLTAQLWKRFHLADCNKRWDSPYRLCRLVCAILPSSWRPCGCRTE